MHSCARPAPHNERRAPRQDVPRSLVSGWSPRAVLLALVDAMCESPAATSSDTGEEELHQNIFNPFFDIFTSFSVGDRLGAYLTGKKRAEWD